MIGQKSTIKTNYP